MVICLEPGADLHIAQLMPLPLTVSCFSKIQIGFIFLVLAHPGSPGQGPLNGIVVCCLTVKCLLDNLHTRLKCDVAVISQIFIGYAVIIINQYQYRMLTCLLSYPL